MTVKLQKKLILSALDSIKQIVDTQSKVSSRYKTIDSVTEGLVVVIGSVASGIALVHPADTYWVEISAALTVGLTLITGVRKSSGLREKSLKAHGIVANLSKLYYDTKLVLSRNHLNAEELDAILGNLYNELSDYSADPRHGSPLLKSSSLMIGPETPSNTPIDLTQRAQNNVDTIYTGSTSPNEVRIKPQHPRVSDLTNINVVI
jgi:hypothetical protein